MPAERVWFHAKDSRSIPFHIFTYPEHPKGITMTTMDRGLVAYVTNLKKQRVGRVRGVRSCSPTYHLRLVKADSKSLCVLMSAGSILRTYCPISELAALTLSAMAAALTLFTWGKRGGTGTA